MAGPLYARYMPPQAKDAQKPSSMQPTASEEQNTLPVRAPLYARYIPPTQAKTPEYSSKETSSELYRPGDAGLELAHASLRVTYQEDSEVRKKEKRKKKKTGQDKAQRTKFEIDEKLPPNLGKAHSSSHGANFSKADRQSDDIGLDHGDPIVDQHPNKRRKRQDAEEGESSEDEQHLKKHKSVLSKYEKSSKMASVQRTTAFAHDTIEEAEPVELHDLVPLPQPLPAPEVEYKPTFSALPRWLAKPTVVSSETRVPFANLAVHPKLLQQLESKGYKEAFAVQSALIPLLLPGPQQHFGDVCVSAATGSGKTLSYILPMVQNLRDSTVTKLRGLIIVPTRELVAQARETAEHCAAGTGIKVGIALGSQSLSTEQSVLVRSHHLYSPNGYEELQERGKAELSSSGHRDVQLLEDCAVVLPNHVLSLTSTVDILICTPGRLVDHIKLTRGFHLRDIKWLVIDEADRLLDQSFQEWTDTVLCAMEAKKDEGELRAREQILRQLEYPGMQRSPTKVILSATMTRNLAKLSLLKLRRPKLLIIQDDRTMEFQESVFDHKTVEGASMFDLPRTLQEFATPAGDGAEKALVLLDILRTRIMEPLISKGPSDPEDNVAKHRDRWHGPPAAATPSIQGDHSNELDRSTNSSFSNAAASMETVKGANEDITHARNILSTQPAAAPTAKVLIFTKDNENASRLSYLLGILHPAYAKLIGTLTKSSTSSAGKKVLAAFRSGKTLILIASDRASRGLDVPNLTHIVNYDIPRSITAYIHRVGRTARAGEDGEAWTLFTNPEGKWFWNAIAKAPEINRPGRKVERVKPNRDAVSDEMRSAYESALKHLQHMVEGNAAEAHHR